MTIIENSKIELSKDENTCVVIKDDIMFNSKERGILPILRWLSEDHNFFEGAFVADKVIGKAVAMLLVYGKVGSVYTRVISQSARLVFEEYNVPCTYDKEEPYIKNRDGTGRCPMESKVMTCSSPEEAYTLFKSIVKIA